jgi:hypothetical protein
MEMDEEEAWVGEGSESLKITWFLEIQIPHVVMRGRDLCCEVEGEENPRFEGIFNKGSLPWIRKGERGGENGPKSLCEGAM